MSFAARQQWGSSPVNLVGINGATYQVTELGNPNDAAVIFQLESDGDISTIYKENGSTAAAVVRGQWLLSGAAADYDAYVSVTSGDTPDTGTIGSNVNLGVTKSWSFTTTARTSEECVLNVEIRRAGGSTPLTSASITLRLTSEP